MSEIQQYDFCTDGMYPSASGGWVDADEAFHRIKELESQLEQAKKDGLEAKQDQARYQYLSRKVGAVRTTDGSKYIFVNLPKCGSYVFKGSVAQHFSEAIDAA